MGLYQSNSPQPQLKNAQAFVNPANYATGNGFPTAVLTGAGNAWVSGVLPAFGLPPSASAVGVNPTPNNLPKQVGWWDNISCGLTSTQNVTITIQCYLDSGGLCAVGAVATSTSSTTPYVGGNPQMPFLYYQVTITNTSGTTAIITNPGIAVGAT